MAKQNRRPRPAGELRRELQDQVTLLAHACASFDKGLRPIGKHIALRLRVLLHQRGTNSQALLQQMGLRSKHFLDTAGDLNAHNLLTDCPLCIMKATPQGAVWEAACVSGGGPFAPRWLQFEEWWNNTVIKDKVKHYFNRRDLILNVADTDGGAHVDSELDDAYMALSRENSLDWQFVSGELAMPLDDPALPSIRQIAHEVLETLKSKAKDVVNVPNVI